MSLGTADRNAATTFGETISLVADTEPRTYSNDLFPDLDVDFLLADQLLPATVAQATAVPGPLTTSQQLQMQRLINAIASWYDHIANRDDQGHSSETHSRQMTDIVLTLEDGLVWFKKHARKGTQLLNAARAKIPTFLRNANSYTAMVLLEHSMSVQNFYKEREVSTQYVCALRTLWTSAACHELGRTHPLTLLVDVLIYDRIPASVCDMLYKAIDLNYLRQLKGHRLAAATIRVRKSIAETLCLHSRFLEVEDWFDSYMASRELFNPTTMNDLSALEFLACSREARGLYLEAEQALDQALTRLQDKDLQCCDTGGRVAFLYARLKEKTNDLVLSEQWYREYLDIAKSSNDEMEIHRAFFELWDFYRKHEKPNAASQLEEAYPGILKDESEFQLLGTENDASVGVNEDDRHRIP